MIIQRIATSPSGISFRQAKAQGLAAPMWFTQELRAMVMSQKDFADKIVLSPATISRFVKGQPASKNLIDAMIRYFKIAKEDQPDFVCYILDGSVLIPRISARHNLPNQLTPLIGRNPLLAAAVTLVHRTDRRLLTLTGPGGIGKTRFAVQLGTVLVDDFGDGVWFIPLAAINDPNLVMPAIARTLAIKEGIGQSCADSVKAFLREKELLLILDNFEQVLSAAPAIADLLIAAPNLKIVITSRAVLNIYGEQEYTIPPLGLPNLVALPLVSQIQEYEAIQLFLDRVQATQPKFVLTSENIPLVAAICVQLDGIPLAIELAAPLTKLLPLSALLTRLKYRLNVLTGGPQNLPSRQQTLRGAIAWSYDLLTPAEQRLFMRLAVFEGGWSLEAMEDVCSVGEDGDVDALAGLGALQRHNLITAAPSSDDSPRFDMVPTLREYALEQLVLSGELDLISNRHTLYYLQLVEILAKQVENVEENPWLAQLEDNYGNLVVMVEWAQLHGKGDLIIRLRHIIWRSGIGLTISKIGVGWVRPQPGLVGY